MENITIEKSFKFDYQIENIESINVNNDLRCEVNEDNSHALGVINVSGIIKTPLGKIDFNEDVEVDVYAPFDKVIDSDNFKIVLKDYSYVVNNKSLTVYIVLDMEGFKETNNQDAIEANYDEIINSMNNINDIKDEDESLVRNVTEPVKEIKSNEVKENINKSWATDLFKLNESYSSFKVIHK